MRHSWGQEGQPVQARPAPLPAWAVTRRPGERDGEASKYVFPKDESWEGPPREHRPMSLLCRYSHQAAPERWLTRGHMASSLTAEATRVGFMGPESFALPRNDAVPRDCATIRMGVPSSSRFTRDWEENDRHPWLHPDLGGGQGSVLDLILPPFLGHCLFPIGLCPSLPTPTSTPMETCWCESLIL